MTGTRRLVLRLWLGLLAATLVTLVGAVVAIDLGRRDAEALRGGEAPAREGLAAAREALIVADSEAVIQFDAQRRDDRRTGPGVAYQQAYMAAVRQLSQVSQADVGAAAAESVQVVNGLLATYSDLIEKAFRDTVSEDLNLAFLQYAHHFLGEEILPQLATLRGQVDQARSPAPAGGRHVLWIVPLIVLAGLLGWAQRTLSRRFRRTLSAPLLAAALLAAGLVVTATLSLGDDGDVARGRATLGTLVGDYQNREADTRERGCDVLRVLSREWLDPPGSCPPAAPDVADDREVLRKANEVSMTAQGAAAAATRAIVTVIVLGLLTGLMITLGLLPRLEEYRFRRR